MLMFGEDLGPEALEAVGVDAEVIRGLRRLRWSRIGMVYTFEVLLPKLSQISPENLDKSGKEGGRVNLSFGACHGLRGGAKDDSEGRRRGGGLSRMWRGVDAGAAGVVS